MTAIGKPMIECIPNISEGRDHGVINEVIKLFQKYDQVNVLDIFIGKETNRTVFTLTGAPKEMFFAMKDLFWFASEHLSISEVTGCHPFIGILDVIPFVALRNISRNSLIHSVDQFCRDVADQFQVPIFKYGYLHEQAFLNLGPIRRGGIGRLEQKLQREDYKPDYGPRRIHPSLGATLIGVRDFMAAFNVNLQTSDMKKAKRIAKELLSIRNAQRQNQNPLISLDSLRILAWYIPEYEICQISTNIYDLNALKLDEAFQLIDHVAHSFGVETCGSELIGMIPIKGLSREKNLEDVIQETGLDSLHPFDPEKKILEIRLGCDSFL